MLRLSAADAASADAADTADAAADQLLLDVTALLVAAELRLEETVVAAAAAALPV